MASPHIEPITMDYIKTMLDQFAKSDVNAANAVRAGILMFQLYDDWNDQRENAIKLAQAGRVIKRRIESLGKRCAEMCVALDAMIRDAEWVAETCGKLAAGEMTET